MLSCVARCTSALRLVKGPCAVTMLAPRAARTIFAPSYIGLDLFKEVRETKILPSIVDGDSLKRTIKDNFEAQGLKHVFADDVIKFINLASTSEDLETLRSILLAFLKDDCRQLQSLPAYVGHFFLLCYDQKNMDMAREMFTDPDIVASSLQSLTSIRLRYYMLLYQMEEYEELLGEIRSSPTPLSLDQATLAVACCYLIGSKEAFQEATQIYHDVRKSERNKSQTRVCAIYSLFSLKMGEPAVAFDAIDSRGQGSTPSTSNLKISILTKTNRLTEALSVIKSEILPMDMRATDLLAPPRRKKMISFEVMQSLTEAIKQAGDPDLVQAMTGLCQALDEKATLSDKTLEEIVLTPIERPPQRTSRSRPGSSRNQKKSARSEHF